MSDQRKRIKSLGFTKDVERVLLAEEKEHVLMSQKILTHSVAQLLESPLAVEKAAEETGWSEIAFRSLVGGEVERFEHHRPYSVAVMQQKRILRLEALVNLSCEALRSYEYGNSSPQLAQQTANFCAHALEEDGQ